MKSGKRKKTPHHYRQRTYREATAHEGLVSCYFRLKETDLHIMAPVDATREAGELATRYRVQVERYVASHPGFVAALTPLPDDDLAPPIIRDMLEAGRNAGVGPMAAVAGAIAEYVGRGLIEAGHKEIIVENGGDIFIKRAATAVVAVFAGESPLSGRIGLQIDASRMPLGICTSSGTVGHSLSFGKADSVTVLAGSTAIADAAATRLGNEVAAEMEERQAVDRALAEAEKIPHLEGVVVICGETLGACGDVELAPLS